MPVLLGDGIPLVPPGRALTGLRRVVHEALPSGIVMLKHGVGGRS